MANGQLSTTIETINIVNSPLTHADIATIYFISMLAGLLSVIVVRLLFSLFPTKQFNKITEYLVKTALEIVKNQKVAIMSLVENIIHAA